MDKQIATFNDHDNIVSLFVNNNDATFLLNDNVDDEHDEYY